MTAWAVLHTEHISPYPHHHLLASLPCPAISAHLFSLALALKSSITFLKRVTVKSPPSASSAIILWEENPLRLDKSIWLHGAHVLDKWFLQGFDSLRGWNIAGISKTNRDLNLELHLLGGARHYHIRKGFIGLLPLYIAWPLSNTKQSTVNKYYILKKEMC